MIRVLRYLMLVAGGVGVTRIRNMASDSGERS